MNHALLPLNPSAHALAARPLSLRTDAARRGVSLSAASALTLMFFAALFNEAQAQDWSNAALSRPVSAQGSSAAPLPTVMGSSLVRVLSATPNLERITETRQQCSYEPQQVASSGSGNSTGAAVLGALAGGLIASNVGKGSGKNVAIAAGSATGALIGKSLAEQQSTPQYNTVQVCRPTSAVREQVRDYTVRYEFQGQEYQVNMPQPPGQWLRVHVSHSVSPA